MPPTNDDALGNRLKKNRARLGGAFVHEKTDAYRLYDRDIPEFPYSVDVYGPEFVVTAHETPVSRRASESDRASEAARVEAAIHATCGPGPIHWKRRDRHLSVERRAEGDARHERPVREHGLALGVNLVDYLDTGLFFDHRPARRRLGTTCAGKSVLNLFCYTGAFTVHAAAGHAARTVSVDLSRTYLDWAARNLARNGFQATKDERHLLVLADAAEWLTQGTDRFDRIVLDPPTVSKSARGRSFDIQRDHVRLHKHALGRLAHGGTLLFSTNSRQFRLSGDAAPGRTITDVTRETLPADVRGDAHLCWEIR